MILLHSLNFKVLHFVYNFIDFMIKIFLWLVECRELCIKLKLKLIKINEIYIILYTIMGEMEY